MSWETQGRQYHMWFGHGTADPNPAPGGKSLFEPGNLDRRIDAVAYGVVAQVPRSDRR